MAHLYLHNGRFATWCRRAARGTSSPYTVAMNWKLIVLLSLFGLAMGIATVFVIPANVEPFFWLVVFVVCAVLIAKGTATKHFLHGLCVSLANSVWITAAHVAFFDTYIASHAREAAMSASMSSPRLMMLAMGPAVGLVSGLVLGLFAYVASRFIKPAGSVVNSPNFGGSS
jgi:hypothetical protein